MTKAEFNNRLVHKFLIPFLKMGPIIYPVFILLDAFGSHPYKWLSILICSFQVLLFVDMVRLIEQRKVSGQRAHQHAFVIVCLVMIGCAFRNQVMGDPNLVFYVEEVLILSGMVMLDYRWLGLSSVTCAGAWALCSVNNLTTAAFNHQALMIGVMGLVSFTCFAVRRTVFDMQYRLHQSEEEQQNQLAKAIEEVSRLADELDARLDQGSKDIAKSVDKLSTTLEAQEVLHQQLLHSQRIEAMGRLAGGVAHEFSNALTIILAHLSELKATTESNEVLEEIEDAADRGRDLIGRLVSLTGHRTLRRRSVTVEELIESQIQPLARGLPGGIEWTLTNETQGAQVHVDSAALYQVFQNLVQNSVQALEGFGQIGLRIYRHQNSVRFEFKDNGPGLTLEAQELMFEPFFTTKAMGEGTGLGLAIAKGVVEGHNGSLSLVETGTAGSTFRMELPRCTQVIEQPEAPSYCPRGAQGEKILFVEDEAAILTLATRYLKRKGFSVLSASDGEQALKILATESDIDLVVTDVVMPRMGGADLASTQLCMKTGPPFLFISGYPDDRLERMGLEKKNVNFLAKPYQLSELGNKVTSLLC